VLPAIDIGGQLYAKLGLVGFSGDAGNVVYQITWSSWGPTSATGYGEMNMQGCVPGCASGTSTPTPATITFSDVVGGNYTAVTEWAADQVVTTWPQGASQVSLPFPGSGSAPAPVTGTYAGDVADIHAAGIVAPDTWIVQTGEQPIKAWRNGEPPSATDAQILLPAGILPGDLAAFDSITQTDLGS
jgi:hypothetical protein